MSNEHTFATPAPAGLGALAVVTVAFYALLSGKVTHAAAPLLACWMIGGGLVQLITGLIELKDKNLVGGNVMLFFGAFFMLVGAFTLLTKYGLHSAGMHMDTRIDGWCWFGAAGFMLAMTPGYLKGTKLMFFIAVLVDIGLILLGIVDLNLPVNKVLYLRIVSWIMLIVCFIALYLVTAIATNTEFKKVLLPIPGPFIK